ncbi:hypothetical protein [Frateuria soli]|uniref:hypothetical protein n=1 Tax=Frateuria soli TaxID=1542730 RepID=UPI001E5C95FF|nr:hypothetical protein [Frateuria soli]UGB38073.1 hypothetical protein LQ771_14890 [Frateuria soli]
MHPLLHRLADAYRPLAARNRLVEGLHPMPAPAPAPRRMSLLALVALWLGRRP